MQIIIFFSDGINTSTGMGLVSGGEDGSVMVWEGTELVQKIPHPSCVWCILGLKGIIILLFF
jgi:hypothetical protein